MYPPNAPTWSRPDVEGYLVRVAVGPPAVYAKRLPIAVAWHVFEPTDLAEAGADVVENVTTEFSNHVHLIRYRAGVEPLDLDSLRDLIHLSGPLGPWRAARLARDLAGDLAALHQADVPQLLVHPERIGRGNWRFVLLPSLAGVLLPLGTMFAGSPVRAWLHAIAPEVLRTRATDATLLLAGAVYSLGATILALVSPGWDPNDATDPFALAEQRVESRLADAPAVPTGFESLAGLCERLCATNPADRPTLADAMAALEEILKQIAPEAVFRERLARQDLPAASRVLRDLEKSTAAGGFGDGKRLHFLLSADLHLAESPPKCAQALTFLQAARDAAAGPDAEVYRRRGRAYALWTDHPDRVAECLHAYGLAARLSDWAADVIDEWMDQLPPGTPPAEFIATTMLVPAARRTRKLVLARAHAYLVLGADEPTLVLDAWEEVAASFTGRPFDPELFEAARQVARLNDPITLLYWLKQYRANPEQYPGLAAPIALVWEMNENEEEAARFLRLARAYAP